MGFCSICCISPVKLCDLDCKILVNFLSCQFLKPFLAGQKPVKRKKKRLHIPQRVHKAIFLSFILRGPLIGLVWLIYTDFFSFLLNNKRKISVNQPYQSNQGPIKSYENLKSLLRF